MTCKAKGNQGNWFAKVTAHRHPEVDGLSLPCIWDVWYDGKGHYFDSGYAPEKSKARAVAEALDSIGYAIMRKRRKGTDPEVWEADGYIAIFKVANVARHYLRDTGPA